MACILDDGQLTLTGFVGDSFWDDGFTQGEVLVALAQIDDDADLTVLINSGGGYATEGAAIYAMLGRRSGQTNLVVDGIAASAASLIAMAGDTITMSAGSVMMIHDPAGMTFGNSADHAKTIEGLEALATSYARVYAARSGKTIEEARDIMKAERWFGPDEALTEGFADEVGEAKAKAVAAFDYRLYAAAPNRLVALSKSKKWDLKQISHEPKASAPAAPCQPKEIDMTDKERADMLAAELETLKAENATMKTAQDDRDRRDAIMALDEANGREGQAKLLADNGVAVESAKAILAAAPLSKDNDTEDSPSTYERQRLDGAGMNRGGGKPDGKSGLSTLVDSRLAKAKRPS
ncbi:head maturation protease, ClpP-related [uncultured Hoeflea sp.]|mgnify:CR=1 FL=1|uniref:head maturation protease, ClpP-related n=1 Tax=uncultured Hoeflea sp. TaxID=538666 RepID=UPI0030D74A64